MHFKTVVTTKRLTRLLSNVKATSTAVLAFIRQGNTWWVERIDCNRRRNNDEQCLLLRMNILPITGIECIFLFIISIVAVWKHTCWSLLIFSFVLWRTSTWNGLSKKTNKCRGSTCRLVFGWRQIWMRSLLFAQGIFW